MDRESKIQTGKIHDADGGGSAAALCPWEQQPGEPRLWYGRFQVYLSLGPTRTLQEAYRHVNSLKNRGGKAPISPSWTWYAKRWRWRERAHAWDAYQRNLLALSEHNTRLALRQRRVAVMEDVLEAIRTTLDTADIASADQAQAREWLPQLRVFLRDMLVAERQEFERPDYARDDPDNALTITADELRAAQRELERAELEGSSVAAAGGSGLSPADHGGRSRAPSYGPGAWTGPVLAVCLGEDPQLLVDLAVLRAVRVASGLKFARILNATRGKFVRYLNRERGFGRPVELLHMGLHASAEGIEFADGLVDGNWLSERLLGVRVLLLACCQGDSLGDWLGVVPYVVSLREDVPHEDVVLLAQHFWQGIGLGQEPGAALDGALAFCPPALSEYVVRHW